MTIDTKPLSERLRACIDTTSDDLASNCISALDAKDALLREARDVIKRLLHPEAPYSAAAIEETGAVIGHARTLLSKLTEATKP